MHFRFDLFSFSHTTKKSDIMKGSIHGIGDLNISPFSFGVAEADCFTGLVET